MFDENEMIIGMAVSQVNETDRTHDTVCFRI